MRDLFKEGDLISAEVQEIRHDGAIALHTRSLKYGKLHFGSFVKVAPGLIVRAKKHFVDLPIGISVILGTNGFIWISATQMTAETETEQITQKHSATAVGNVSPEMFSRVALVRNAIAFLDSEFMAIDSNRIMNVIQDIDRFQIPVSKILFPENRQKLTNALREPDTDMSVE
mmetsp:Transcript_13716/g.24608  ORF Transcript_13716/g.24608 Transcript_13716/m.24608 type:complete len:172 (-) Transcript_13716:628-1143(-)